MQRWKLHFFRIFRCICFGVVAFVFVCFPFFFRKKNARVDQSCKKNATEKMQRRKLQKNAAEKMQRWKLHFFAFSVAFVLVPLHFCLHFLRFFRKKNTKVDQSCKKMQRRKCNVASWKLHFFCIFRSG